MKLSVASIAELATGEQERGAREGRLAAGKEGGGSDNGVGSMARDDALCSVMGLGNGEDGGAAFRTGDG